MEQTTTKHSLTKSILYSRFTPVFFLGYLFFLTLLSSWPQSVTYDEPYHLGYGLKVLHGDTNRHADHPFYDSKMPVSAINGLGYMLSEKFISPKNANKKKISLFIARSGTAFFLILLGWYVFKWSHELYGREAGILSLFLFGFSPNLIAHAGLITTDVPAAAFFFITTYYFWNWINEKNLRNAILVLLFFGISQLVKNTNLFLFPTLFLIYLFSRFPFWKNHLHGPKKKKYFLQEFSNGFKITAAGCLSLLLIVNVGFFFHGTLTEIGGIPFRSGLFSTLPYNFPFLRFVPIPLPYPYITGLDWVLMLDGKYIHQQIYLLGELRFGEPFYSYYFWAYLLKEPIGHQIIFYTSLLLIIAKDRFSAITTNNIFLFIPILFYFVYLNFFFNTQIGIRYLLPALPFIYVFCGRIISSLKTWNRLSKGIIYALLIFSVISVWSYFPHYIPYFNELILDRKMAYKFLADSNLDWGQSKDALNNYRIKNPNVIFLPKPNDHGLAVIPANSLTGVVGGDEYRWLFDNYEPVSHLNYSNLIFELK